MKYHCLYRLLCLLVVLGQIAVPAQDKPNVLFIISDDLNNAQSTYQWREVKTPNIDRLADEGLRFERAYCQGTECSSSRTSFTFGLYPNITGNSVPAYLGSNPARVTMPRHFRDNGYYTARVGKFHHQGVPMGVCDGGGNDADDGSAWVFRKDFTTSVDCQRWPDRIIADSSCTHQGGCLSWLIVDEPDEMHSDGMVATEVIRLLQERSGTNTPFFIAAGFYRPHVPYIAPGKYFDMYPLDSITVAPDIPGDLDDIPGAARIHTEYSGLDETIQKHCLQGYYASISLMDAQVGRLLKALDDNNLRDKTIVLFTSDQGYNLGEHEQWEKPSVFEEGARVPLIFRVPNITTPGTVTYSFAELSDIFPTLTDLCGVQAPDYLIGRSLRPVLENPLVPVRKFAVTWKTSNGISIRSRDFRYSQYGGSWGSDGNNGKELYDHVNDPNEYTNLAGNGQYSDIQDELGAIAQEVGAADYVPVYAGCKDSAYAEYNPSADVEDEDMCENLLGCLDSAYAEYNSQADVHDSSLCVTLGVSAGQAVQGLKYIYDKTSSRVLFYMNGTGEGAALLIHDMRGALIKKLVSINQNPIVWDTGTIREGVFIIVLSIGNRKISRIMVL